ncbi:hypothetical protein OF83DRAFT_1119243 [Amylostereum chailletii]|nr:hypothetical protein OF83DRAFT_1119243 [Amylostereum chailletii]
MIQLLGLQGPMHRSVIELGRNEGEVENLQVETTRLGYSSGHLYHTRARYLHFCRPCGGSCPTGLSKTPLPLFFGTFIFYFCQQRAHAHFSDVGCEQHDGDSVTPIVTSANILTVRYSSQPIQSSRHFGWRRLGFTHSHLRPAWVCIFSVVVLTHVSLISGLAYTHESLVNFNFNFPKVRTQQSRSPSTSEDRKTHCKPLM